jgi:hypothetical protein
MTSTQTVRIAVRGRLTDHLAGLFEGMTAVHRAGATELAGTIADQAQLHGLLMRIRDLGLEIESMHVSPETPRQKEWSR